MQPIVLDGNGVVRFKENKIVRVLLDWATPRGMSLNEMAMMDFSQDDRMQFAQLIGYSVNGYHELSYVSDQSAAAATQLARQTLGQESPMGCRDEGCSIHCGVEEESE